MIVVKNEIYEIIFKTDLFYIWVNYPFKVSLIVKMHIGAPSGLFFYYRKCLEWSKKESENLSDLEANLCPF